jgi:hypothetical protein
MAGNQFSIRLNSEQAEASNGGAGSLGMSVVNFQRHQPAGGGQRPGLPRTHQ